MVELLCTLTGVIAGVAIVASLLQQQGARQKFSADGEPSESDRMSSIADQLQVISHRVAADVSAHSEKVEHISDRLAAPSADPEQVLSTINEIISANQAMQGQLADAQKRIAQQSRMIEQATLQAHTDALTGLANRRALNEFLTNSLETVGEKTVTGLLLMDIDHFKSFNDNFGHATGDAVLASFARSISTCCGDSSYAARYGGEEFAVVLSAENIESLVRQAAEVRFYVSEQVINHEDLQLKITASGGLCVLQPGDNCSAIYERSDEGLYQAKKAGRNRGFWLSPNGWLPFPARAGNPQLLADLKNGAALASAAPPATAGLAAPANVAPITRSEAQATFKSAVAAKITLGTEPEPIELTEQYSAEIHSAETHSAEIPARSNSSATLEAKEILDLNNFVNRLEAFLEQLRKAGLPASAFMAEAIGLADLNTPAANQCWNKILTTVQENMRGIDVICLYRPYTLCIFLPGCSLDACVARAAKVRSALRDFSQAGPSNALPSKFAISAAAFDGSEDNAHFLNRLELALEEAQDATDRELVIHDGTTCHFQEAM